MFSQAVLLCSVLLFVNGLPSTKIIGGLPIGIEDAPYQVSIQYLNQHLCGGIIISEKVILTAASCTNGLQYKFVSVRIASELHNQGGEVLKVSEIRQHPDYPSDINKDLAALILANEIEFNVKAFSIPLAERGASYPSGAEAVITGWGYTAESGPKADQLQSVTVPIVDRKTCRKLYANRVISNDNVCAGNLNGGAGFCKLDIGGPLTIDNTLIGVASWGIGCARPDLPGVYADVGSLRDFIDTLLTIPI